MMSAYANWKTSNFIRLSRSEKMFQRDLEAAIKASQNGKSKLLGNHEDGEAAVKEIEDIEGADADLPLNEGN